MRCVLAADLGGTKCRFALVGEDFGVRRVVRIRTPRDRDGFLAGLDGGVEEVLGDLPEGFEEPLGMGVGTAGVIPPDGRSVVHAPNLPLDGFGLAGHIEERFGLRTRLINDGRASAWGEYLRGEARGSDPLLCLFFGTGVGIGLVIGGRPYGGADNAAGEIGHTVHVPGGRRCPCGRDGHFEAYCGGRAMERRAKAEIGEPPGGGDWDVGKILADDRDAARTILEDARRAATALVASACTLLNPRAVVLGGGVLEVWPELRGAIEDYVREQCTPPVTEGLVFVPSLGGSDAVLWGAAAATGELW